MKHRRIKVLGMVDCYKGTKRYLKQQGKKLDMELTDFTGFITDALKLQAMDMIKGKPIYLPHALGVLYLQKCKMKKRPDFDGMKARSAVDWGASTKLWKEQGCTEGKALQYEDDYFKVAFSMPDFGKSRNVKLMKFFTNRSLRFLIRDCIRNGVINPDTWINIDKNELRYEFCANTDNT